MLPARFATDSRRRPSERPLAAHCVPWLLSGMFTLDTNDRSFHEVGHGSPTALPTVPAELRSWKAVNCSPLEFARG